MKRFGMTVGLRPECLAEYKRIHVKIWRAIEGAIRAAGIRNYSIYYVDARLFGYFEYEGPPEQFKARMQRLAAAPRMRQWWDITEPMQVPGENRPPETWWTDMEEVFHQD